MKIKKIGVLVLFIIIPLVIGFTSGLFTQSSVDTWYQEINRPSFAPPNWIFAPVWTTLYILMGISAFLVWNAGWKEKNVKVGLILFFIQLGLNFLWSVLFIGLQNPFLAFIEIIILWVFILLTMIWFNRVSKAAMWMLLPYILWVSFAAFLNLSFWLLNFV